MPEQKSKNEIVTALKQAGMRLTRQRLAIIEYIAGRRDHPSARQILNEIRTASGISFATIYNTLKTLVELGLIKEIDFEHAENRYDTNLEPHLNLVCLSCRKIEDVNVVLPVSPEKIRSRNNFIATNYRLEFIGICAECQKEER